MPLSLLRCRSRIGAVALIAVAILAIHKPNSAESSVAIALDLPGLVKISERIVVADVVSVKSAWDGAHRTILSTVELAVGETWKGPVSPTGRISVVQIGGTVDGIVMFVPGQAQFVANERAVLFLRGGEQSAMVVGLGQGKRPLQYDVKNRLWMVAGGDRSAAVHLDSDGHMTAAKPEAAVPLESLRRDVRALVAK
jgi:hypothetical protein